MPDPTRPISKIPRVANRHRQETPFSLKEKKIQAAIISLNEEKAFDYYLLKTITAATTLLANHSHSPDPSDKSSASLNFLYILTI